MSGEFSQSKNNKLNFKKLPVDAQKKLLILNRRGEDRFVFWPKPSIFTWLCVALPLAWIAYVLYATRGPLWADWMFWLYAALTIIAALAFVFGIAKIVSVYAAKLKNGYIFTPNEFIVIKGNCVQSWGLAEVESLTYLEDERLIEVGILGHDEKFKPSNKYDVRRLGEVFDEWKRNATGNFLANYEKPEFAYSPGGKTFAYAGAVIVAVILGAGLCYASMALNRNYDDELSWKKASGEPTLKTLDEYKSRHPQGKHLSEADEKISGLLSALKAEYLSKVTKEADPKAVTAFTTLLESVSKDPRMTIYITVRETRELDESIVSKAKKISGESVHDYEQTLPRSGEEKRKELIVETFKHAFGEQIKNADVKFEYAAEPPPGASVIDISYKLKSHESVYNFYLSAARKTFYYPGVKFNFDFALKPTNHPDPFQVNFETMPDRLDTGVFKLEDSGNYSFDKVLFGAALEKFRNFVQAKFGFIDITNT